MEAIKKKIQFSLAMLLTTFLTVIFSIVFALSAQQLSVKNGVTINYEAPRILVSGSSFNSNISSDCTSIIFDYARNHPTISSSFTPTTVDSKNLGLSAGGISSYYDSTNTTLYVLSNNEIFANEDSSKMFYQKSYLQSIQFNNFDTSNVTDMNNMFYGCSSITTLDLTSFNTSNVKNMKHMFSTGEYHYSYKSGWMYDYEEREWYESALTTITWDNNKFNTSNVTDMSGMFAYSVSLTDVDLSKFDTSNVTDMSSMFQYCGELSSLDVSSFNTSKVTNMSYMFATTNLEHVDDSGHDNINIISGKLTSIQFGTGWNVESVTDMSYMFYYSSLTSLNLSNFNTSSVTDMSYMFSNCSSLTSLDLSSFNTSNVTNMYDMFYNCSSLISLDLSSFNTSNVARMSYMFYNCSKLTTIYVSSNWSTGAVTYSIMMFYGCSNLVGGAGTVYSSSYVDATYAKVDGGTASPGYLTLKQ